MYSSLSESELNYISKNRDKTNVNSWISTKLDFFMLSIMQKDSSWVLCKKILRLMKRLGQSWQGIRNIAHFRKPPYHFTCVCSNTIHHYFFAALVDITPLQAFDVFFILNQQLLYMTLILLILYTDWMFNIITFSPTFYLFQNEKNIINYKRYVCKSLWIIMKVVWVDCSFSFALAPQIGSSIKLRWHLLQFFFLYSLCISSRFETYQQLFCENLQIVIRKQLIIDCEVFCWSYHYYIFS